MTKRDKRELAIRRNTRQVRFDDLHIVMTDNGFVGDRNRPHVVYHHAKHADVQVNVAKPHGGTTHVKPFYVEQALAAIDEAKARG